MQTQQNIKALLEDSILKRKENHYDIHYDIQLELVI